MQVPNWTPLHHAVFRNDLAQTDRLLAQESVDPNVLTLVRSPLQAPWLGFF
jgi:hypothetical protein